MAKKKKINDLVPSLINIFKYFSVYIKQQKTIIVLSTLALVSQVAFRLLEPWPIKYIFDYLLLNDKSQESAVNNFLNNFENNTVLIILCLALVIFATLRAAANYISTVGFAVVGNRVIVKVREKLFSHLQALSLNFHDKTKTGDLTLRLIGDVGILRDVTVTAILPFIGNILIIVGIMIVMFIMHWKLALASTILLPLFWLRTKTLSTRLHGVSREQRKRQGAMSSMATESFNAIKTVQALVLNTKFAEMFSSQSNKDFKDSVKAKKIEANLGRTVDVIVAASTAIVLWYGVKLVFANEITPGDILIFVTYLKAAFKPIRDSIKYTGRLSRAVASGERVLDILQVEPEIYDLPGSVEAPDFKGRITFENVNFSYDDKENTLNNINFDIKPGQFVAIAGPSGNGKSTILSLLLRLYDPKSGTVRMDGSDIRNFKISSLRSQITILLQDNILFAESIKDNIACGLYDIFHEQIVEAAKLANAHEFITTFPKGYDTMIGERGATLSNGQRQRIAIARAIIKNSPVLILDEPTASLDENNEVAVIQAIEALRKDKTTILVTHKLKQAQNADQILYIKDGNIIDCGTHTQLLESCEDYNSLFYLQNPSKDNLKHKLYVIPG
ncbi:MAG: ATP-binding cassette domain-containing protein [Nitrosopumilaceae archaeon]|nr:ATP-binding cassette domain-containing protein [Nitrosopumilaceae archaeon]